MELRLTDPDSWHLLEDDGDIKFYSAGDFHNLIEAVNELRFPLHTKES